MAKPLRHSFALAALSMGLFFAQMVIAQTGGQPVRVQLPTLHVFGVSTTVLVPDRGSLILGGVNSSSHSHQRFGLGNRSYSRSTSAGGVGISATLIDHHDIDRAILAEAARSRGATHDVLGRPVSPQRPAAASTTAKPLGDARNRPPAPRQRKPAAKPNWRAIWRSK